MRLATHWRNCISLVYIRANVGVGFFELPEANFDKFIKPGQQLSLAGLVNLSKVSRLRVFSLYAIIKCKAPRGGFKFAVLHDINTVLGTIPESNEITNLGFDFKIVGRRPFLVCLDQDWAEMYNEVIRISNGKPLEMELQKVISMGNLETEFAGQDVLYTYIMDQSHETKM